MDSPNKEKDKLGYLIRFLILAWTAALLTASYMGKMEKMDPTYVASILSGTLATFAIEREKKQ
jgi:hypothetical protein|tara:strand:+ start:390 stop:578 length:189 start_codon:yes stop_codon:yes gene_type:complete